MSKAMLTASVLAFSGLMALAGCDGKTPAQDHPAADSSHANDVVITDKDKCDAVTLAPGQTLVVRLDGNPTTGYRWVLRDAPSLLTFIQEPQYEEHPHEGNMVGVGGTFSWGFTAQQHGGEGDITFEYTRPWEQQQQPERTFQCHVKVDTEKKA